MRACSLSLLGGQRSISGILLCHFLLYSLETRFLTEVPQIDKLARMSQQLFCLSSQQPWSFM